MARNGFSGLILINNNTPDNSCHMQQPSLITGADSPPLGDMLLLIHFLPLITQQVALRFISASWQTRRIVVSQGNEILLNNDDSIQEYVVFVSVRKLSQLKEKHVRQLQVAESKKSSSRYLWDIYAAVITWYCNYLLYSLLSNLVR